MRRNPVEAVCAASALIAAPEWTVTVDPNVELGPIRRMNAVNNDPTKPRSDQTKGNFDEYAALKIPYARTLQKNLQKTLDLQKKVTSQSKCD